MNKLTIYSAGIFLSLASGSSIADTEDHLDEVTIRIFHDDHINNDIHEIELPHSDDTHQIVHEDHVADHEADHEDEQTEVHEEPDTQEDNIHGEDVEEHAEPEPEEPGQELS